MMLAKPSNAMLSCESRTRKGVCFEQIKVQEGEAADHSLELPSKLLGYSFCRRGCSWCRRSSHEHTDREGLCKTHSQFPWLKEELLLPKLSTVQMPPAGAQGQHPQTNTVLWQCHVIHLSNVGKTLVISHVPLHHLLCTDSS